VRAAVGIDVPVTNPLDTPIDLKVHYGHTSLTGPSTLSLQPHEAGMFSFYFAPLAAGKAASAIKLAHAAVGEFWYRVKHEATPAGPKQAKMILGAIASVTEAKVPFANPLEQPLTFSVTSSDTKRFNVTPKTLRLQPSESKELTVAYTPRSLSSEEYAKLTFENEVWHGSVPFVLWHNRHASWTNHIVDIARTAACHCKRFTHLCCMWQPQQTVHLQNGHATVPFCRWLVRLRYACLAVAWAPKRRLSWSCHAWQTLAPHAPSPTSTRSWSG
jgi:Abnormal spindle-like microcephaly-assoc'd, ASPM-SPD-2-Hydin